MKKFRTSIAINGKQYKSPRFNRKSDADAWRDAMKRKKQFMRDGVDAPINRDISLDDYFKTWLSARKRSGYPRSTWESDKQRYLKYVSPMLGGFKVANINALQVRTMLKNVTDEHKQSISTRNKVRSLCSKLFNDSMNEEIPLRADNPALNISFTDPRVGRSEPKHIKREKDVLAFLRAAKSLGRTHMAYAAIALMSGLRRQEIIALRWNDFNEQSGELIVDEKHISAGNQIVRGSKAGSEEIRTVPIPDELVETLTKYKSKCDFQNDEDFILSRDSGEHLSARQLNDLHNKIRALSGIDITPHGLRHTYGRMFALKSGNMKVLQTILGHSSSSTTELYSKLAGKAVNKHRNTINLRVENDDE